MVDYLFEKVRSLNKHNHVSVAKVLLRCLHLISDSASLLGEKVQRPNQLIDVIGDTLKLGVVECKVTHIRTPINVSCEPEFIALMKSFFISNPKW